MGDRERIELLLNARAEAWAIDKLASLCYQIAELLGWHPEKTQENRWAEFGTWIALAHSELSQALEEWRAGRLHEGRGAPDMKKPIGVPSELADAIIRILDTAFALQIPLGEVIYNKLEYCNEFYWACPKGLDAFLGETESAAIGRMPMARPGQPDR